MGFPPLRQVIDPAPAELRSDVTNPKFRSDFLLISDIWGIKALPAVKATPTELLRGPLAPPSGPRGVYPTTDVRLCPKLPEEFPFIALRRVN